MAKRKTLDNKLDREWARLVKERDLKCQMDNCHRTKQLNAHHIFSRRARSTRWDLDNGITLCPFHHNFGTAPNISAHGEPRAFFKWLEKKKGKKWVDDLDKRYRETRKWTTHEKEELLIELKKL